MTSLKKEGYMESFIYQMPVKVYFGQNGVREHLASELKKYGPNIMLAYGKGAIKRIGLYDELVEILFKAVPSFNLKNFQIIRRM